MNDVTPYKVGECMPFAEDPGPDWLRCDGRTVLRKNYPDLFEATPEYERDADLYTLRLPNLLGASEHPYYIRVQVTDSDRPTTAHQTVGDGVFLRQGGQVEHKCSLPDQKTLTKNPAGIPYTSAQIEPWIWMCLTCYKVYRLRWDNGMTWHWTQLTPWRELWWRRKWKRQELASR